MKFHKTDLFSRLMTVFDIPGLFWSDKGTMTSSVKSFKILIFRCIYCMDENFLPESFL